MLAHGENTENVEKGEHFTSKASTTFQLDPGVVAFCDEQKQGVEKLH